MSEMEFTEKEAANHAMRWYGWGSPVGLGLFTVLIAIAIALVRFAFR